MDYVGKTVEVISTTYGFHIYCGMVGTVTKAFHVRGHGVKVVIEFPPRRSEIHGGMWTPHPLEIFVRSLKVID